MPSNVTPFLMTISGKDRLIEASNVGEALKVATEGAISRCKAATGKEYASFVRAGGTVEQAGAAAPFDPAKFAPSGIASGGGGEIREDVSSGEAAAQIDDAPDEVLPAHPETGSPYHRATESAAPADE